MKKQIVARSRTLKRAFNLWLLLAFFLCAGTCLVAIHAMFRFDLMQGRLSNVCAAARSVYEREGSQQLASFLQGADAGPGGHMRLLDARGRDLASGQDDSAFRPLAWGFPALIPRPGPFVIDRTAKYSCIVEPPAHFPGIPFDPMLWVLPFVSIFCCTVAAYVTWRMRRIEAAVHHFGSGQLAVRMTWDSGDSIGRLARAFNQMAERIESLVGAHQRLCADMAHELRSPVTRLLVAIPLARRGAPGALDRIEMEASRVNDLVNELLEIERAEVDPAALDLESVDLRSLLTEIADYYEIEARERGCEIELIFSQPGRVMGDSELLRRAIENIVRNAVEHSPAGTRIELLGGGEAEFALISVRDWGPGVPDSLLEEIFRPFYRVELGRDRSTGGIGLGLAIAQRAIAVHRGTVRAENCTPGLRVKIRLPRE